MYNFKNKKVAVLGWGINGADAAKYLQKQSAVVTILDIVDKSSLDFFDFNPKNAIIRTGPDYLKKGLKDFDYVFRAPGVYRYLPEIVKAEEDGVIITSAVKLFFEICPGKIIGVTGTKGKGTTSTLIYEIIKSMNKNVFLAGNIGSPMLDLLPKLNSESWVILELSSFQLIDMTKSPYVAVVLNITEDHMDWHKDRNEYIQAKSQIVAHQNKNDFSVIAYDYPDSNNFASLTDAKTFFFSNNRKVKGSYVSNNNIYLSVDNDILLGKTDDLLLRGRHNWENVCAAACTSYLAGASADTIKKTIYSFRGLEHRLELVDSIDGIAFYNDSFSTNPQTTAAAVDSFNEDITLILGGSDKGLNYDELGKHITQAKNVKSVILIGLIAGKIERSLQKAGFRGKIIHLENTDMKEIVSESYKNTPKKGIVLLSPATASFDMFENYKQRGKEFKNAVRELKNRS